MSKGTGFAFIFGFLIGHPFALSAQAISEEGKKLIQEHLQKNKQDVTIAVPYPAVREKYKTPSIFESSDSSESGPVEASLSPSSRESEPKGLKPFGFDIFNGSAATIAPVQETYLLGLGDQLIINLWGRADHEHNLSIGREGKFFIRKVDEMMVRRLK